MSLPSKFLHLRNSGTRLAVAGALLCLSAATYAIDFGPDGMFSLTGFAKMETSMGSNQCKDCALFPLEDKQRIWADQLGPGREYKTMSQTTILFQPWLGAKYNLGQGFTASALLSQRFRGGASNVLDSVKSIDRDMAFDPNIWYEKNIAISHEDYGRVAVGSMTARGWAVADYPYGTNIGLSNEWAGTGAGYGMLGNAIRVTTRPLDVMNGDLVLEATIDQGKTEFTKNKPLLIELYAQYHQGDLVLDAVYQSAKNGKPMAWGHGPFTGLTDSAADDSKLVGSDQSMLMLLSRYQLTSQIEVSAGIRSNQWSGAPAIQLTPDPNALWNTMFNPAWDSPINGFNSPGYGITSIDLSLGARYRTGPWSASAGLVYLGKAKTQNPTQRAKDMSSNDATVGSLGLSYDYGSGLQIYGFAGMVYFDRLGLSPISMPSNSSIGGVDSRAAQGGNWFGAGAVYTW
jgi:hypothetical protein